MILYHPNCLFFGVFCFGLVFGLGFLFLFLFCFVLFGFLGPHSLHMEVPRLGVELELQPPAYITVPATPDPSHLCNLHHSSGHHRILNPLSEARDWTHNLIVPIRIRFHCATTSKIVLPQFYRWKNWKFREFKSFSQGEHLDYNPALTQKPMVLKHYINIFNLVLFFTLS